ncbi:hypothetical protein OK116_06450 [Xylella fastidiosa subsp. fastidiosa]|jgi:hypothetical protein|uniref:Uncharacterized protein n=1 Tax=Xylella fastidiosa (strain M23) TaxID=405441 RepID=B2I5L6_XYLF2|nr:hypothetical protein [Xylella fastidiosa]KAF0570729.1 hypothetical protein P305_11515 [Xylella fastidiosa subsp. fastidiosa Mus-1]ACB92661.1 hypothetical protein XfasM23_1233 [Xylella fastidiosa M23]EGO83021.1 hypothetical protein XFEB_00106 [Xylella fastidiosa EB92.1]MDC7964462.1 hypothetical protein [Xylella fastidiosa]QPC03475.1 hypothetical protein IUD25_06145 [Xylella fastidiosa subsp. fastidiosa]
MRDENYRSAASAQVQSGSYTPRKRIPVKPVLALALLRFAVHAHAHAQTPVDSADMLDNML